MEEEKELIPDTDSLIGFSRVMSDQGIVHPCAPSNVRLAAKGELEVAAAYEKDKIEKYQALAQQRGARFFPIILETTGGMGKQAALGIAHIISAAKHSSRWAPLEVVNSIRERLCVSVLRWNAAMIAEGLWRSRAV